MYFLTPVAIAAVLAGSATAAPGDCSPLRGGSAPVPTPNTPEAFASFSYYDNVANSTGRPAKYESIMVAGHAAIQDDNAYITYKELPSYNVGACAKQCDGVRECAACKSSNLHFHRGPLMFVLLFTAAIRDAYLFHLYYSTTIPSMTSDQANPPQSQPLLPAPTLRCPWPRLP